MCSQSDDYEQGQLVNKQDYGSRGPALPASGLDLSNPGLLVNSPSN